MSSVWKILERKNQESRAQEGQCDRRLPAPVGPADDLMCGEIRHHLAEQVAHDAHCRWRGIVLASAAGASFFFMALGRPRPVLRYENSLLGVGGRIESLGLLIMRNTLGPCGGDRRRCGIVVGVVPGGAETCRERPARRSRSRAGRNSSFGRRISWRGRRRCGEKYDQKIRHARQRRIGKTYTRKSLLILLKPLHRPVRSGQDKPFIFHAPQRNDSCAAGPRLLNRYVLGKRAERINGPLRLCLGLPRRFKHTELNLLGALRIRFCLGLGHGCSDFRSLAVSRPPLRVKRSRFHLRLRSVHCRGGWRGRFWREFGFRLC